jgi:anti-sigma B factor antagonist
MQTANPRVGILVVTLPQGTLTATNVDPFREQYFAALAGVADVRTVIMDLSGITFLDSSGLGALIALLKRTTESGGDIKLAGLRKEIRLVFEITRAYKIFDIFDSVEEALRVVP